MKISNDSLNQLFLEARTHAHWQEKEVPDALLKEIYDVCKMGPTSANCCPIRIIFVKSQQAKEKLKPALVEGNIEKTMSAPVTAILAADYEFYKHLPKLFPHEDAKAWFEGNPSLIEATAFRNSSLQGAYFIIAARALGLDCGPMSGFNNAYIDKHFFKDTGFKSNFLCNLGYGKPERLYPRAPRFDFDEVCQII